MSRRASGGLAARGSWRGRFVIVSALVAAGLTTGVAFADWLASGTGSGYAKAHTAEPLRTISAAAAPTLYPGGTGDFVITIENPNPYPVTVMTIARDGPITSDKDGCDPPSHGVVFSDQAGAWVLPGKESATYTLADSVAMAPDSPAACQGATFTIPVALSGASGVRSRTTTTTSRAVPLGNLLANNESDMAAEVDFCGSSPPSLVGPSGAPLPAVFGEVFEAGMTEVPGATTIIAQLGYGPAGSDPRTATGWTWLTAAYNTQNGNNDEYLANLIAPVPGTYSYAYRFSLDGTTATYCDLADAGSNPGRTFDPTKLGVLTVNGA